MLSYPGVWKGCEWRCCSQGWPAPRTRRCSGFLRFDRRQRRLVRPIAAPRRERRRRSPGQPGPSSRVGPRPASRPAGTRAAGGGEHLRRRLLARRHATFTPADSGTTESPTIYVACDGRTTGAQRRCADHRLASGLRGALAQHTPACRCETSGRFPNFSSTAFAAFDPGCRSRVITTLPKQSHPAPRRRKRIRPL